MVPDSYRLTLILAGTSTALEFEMERADAYAVAEDWEAWRAGELDGSGAYRITHDFDSAIYFHLDDVRTLGIEPVD